MTEQRRTGLSTAIALESLARAIRHPGKWFKTEDHFVDEKFRPHRVANQILYDRIQQMARVLELRFEFKLSNESFRSMHYGIEVDREKHRFRQLPDGDWIQQ